MKYGDIELANAKIYNLKVEGLNEDPTFSADELSRIYFNTVTNTYRFNNGAGYVDLSLPNNFSAFAASMGSWINADFTFNPTPFNSFNTITGLTSNSSLFDVLSQLDSALGQVSSPKLGDLNGVVISDDIADGDIMHYDGTNYSFASVDTLIENYSTLGILSLKDVNKAIVDGGSIVYNTDSKQFDIKQTTVLIQDYYNDTSHAISHGLGVRYLGISVINRDTGNLISNADVTFLDENSLNITLPNPAPIVVILTIPFGLPLA